MLSAEEKAFKTIQEPINKRLARKIGGKYFLLPGKEEKLFGEALMAFFLRAGPKSLFQSFKKNIEGAITTVSIPYTMAEASVLQSRFQSLHLAARISALKIGNPPEKKGEDVALRDAQSEFQKELKSKVNIFANQILKSLDSKLKHQNFLLASRELLRQGVVLIWSSFEVFSRDFFISLFNDRPVLMDRLRNSKDFIGYSFVKSMPMEVLAKHHYKIENKLGDLLISQIDFSSLPTLKKIYKAVLPEKKNLLRLLECKSIWLLNQRRHLIVHKRGVVDEAYLRLTGDRKRKGAPIEVFSRDIEDYISTVCKIVQEASQVLC